MKDTELKARFFAQYWGQDIFYNDVWGDEEGVDITSSKFEGSTASYVGIIERAWMELTPLSQITDEDAIEIGFPYASDLKASYDLEDDLPHSLADNLRKLGYAISYGHVSVEEQIKYGWTKLKEKS